MPEAGRLIDRLKRLLAHGGAIPLSLYMSYANAHYYATRDPLGADGDFTTAPEISQMFGEMIGLWCADLWQRAGRPDCVWVELGPGRGTLAADARRVMGRFGFTPDLHLVETSPTLRDRQSAAVPGAVHHDEIAGLPRDRPLIVIANEFFDALPIRQLHRTPAGWRERVVQWDRDALRPALGNVPMDAAVPPAFADAPIGSILETSPASVAIARGIAQRIVDQGGALLTIDYGHDQSAPGETLQAVRGHAYADPFAHPGEQDLTAHVDFDALAQAWRAEGAVVHGPVGQGAFLQALGIDARAQSLADARPDVAQDIHTARVRLTGPSREGGMGELFRVAAAIAPTWPAPEGFA